MYALIMCALIGSAIVLWSDEFTLKTIIISSVALITVAMLPVGTTK